MIEDKKIAAEEKARADEKIKLAEEEEARLADIKLKKEKEEEATIAKELADAKKVADEKIRLEQLVESEKQNAIGMGFAAAQAIAGENDKASKAIAVAQTIYNTQQAIMNAMANIPAPFNIATAVSTGIMGAMSIKNILLRSSVCF